MQRIVKHLRAATLVLIILSLASAALAGDHPHERRGFMLGFGLGGGDFSTVREDDKETVFANSEEGGSAGLRFGYGFNDQLVLGLEIAGWGRERDSDELSVGSTLLNLTWHPCGGGFFLRGGVGGGGIEIEADLGAFNLGVGDEGPAVGFGLGYEWRLTRTFALGGAFDFRYIDLDDTNVPEDTNWGVTHSSMSVQLNWYL